MIKNGLANMLNIVGNLNMKDVYEDCIFEKIHNLPYNNNVIFMRSKL